MAQNPSDKDKSKAQSRSIPAKGKGGNTPKPRPGGAPATASAPSNRGTKLAWGAVALVLVLIIGGVIVAVTHKSSSTTSTSNQAYTPTQPAPASVVKAVTTIPESVYNTVGANFPAAAAPVTPPTFTSGQPPMTLNGKTPAVLYYGGEYCPYCAAERWAMTAALARFGTFSDLKITASSHTDVYPATHTLSFYRSSFKSSYFSFFPVERYSTVPLTDGSGGYENLQKPTAAEQANAVKYSSSQFIQGSQGGISFPFINMNNQALIAGATYSPGILAGLSWTDIANGLNDPTNPVTQAIVGASNLISASLCKGTTNEQPASVCTSSGVTAAAKVLKIG